MHMICNSHIITTMLASAPYTCTATFSTTVLQFATAPIVFGLLPLQCPAKARWLQFLSPPPQANQ